VNGGLVLKVIAFLGLSLFFLYGFYDSLTTGKTTETKKGNYWNPPKTKVYTREKNPIVFWSQTFFSLLASIILLLAALWEAGILKTVLK
jgi:hypothetical protein